jgi:hypothetical protein
MNMNEEIWKILDDTPKLNKETKEALHVRLSRLFEQGRSSPVGKKLGVTVMTQEGSMAGDASARDRSHKNDPGQSRPKSL